MNKKLWTIIGLGLVLSFPSFGGDLNIYADKQVEIHQNEQKLVALGNAKATQDGRTVIADKLTAYYQKTPAGKTTFSKLQANGNVKADIQNSKAFGEEMIYDLSKDKVTLTGKPGKVINPNGDIITAEKNIIYYPQQNKAIANGNVIAYNKDNKVHADKMISYFKKNAKGESEIDKIEIFGHVKINTKDAEATSDRGTYLPQIGLVQLHDNVVINQQGNIIRGSYAETDLNTGISKMKSGTNGKRVSGVFKSTKDKADKRAEENKNGN